MIPDSLLAAVLESPADDLPRLAAADWLEEVAGEVECPRCEGCGRMVMADGGGVPKMVPLTAADAYVWSDDPEDCPTCRGTGTVPDGRAARAEFIRVQVELSRVRSCCPVCNPETGHRSDCLHGDRGDALRRRESELWGGGVGASFDQPPLMSRMGWERTDGEPNTCVVTRGFVSLVRCRLDYWQQHAPALLAAHPLERVEVADVPGLMFQVRPIGGRWWIVGRFGVSSHAIDFPARPALVTGAAAAVAEIAGRLRAGGRWPWRYADGQAVIDYVFRGDWPAGEPAE